MDSQKLSSATGNHILSLLSLIHIEKELQDVLEDGYSFLSSFVKFKVEDLKEEHSSLMEDFEPV